ncbi:fructosamine kinase family protein [Salipaludibacillus sp. CUR1]|uniref:fructosamine kinase family protein n=1 Tax=Salipaludibacillus sp. CUR1 TaxID=2820003 RepID=UPI001E53AA3B|nr:fructosamine kinase family protein [Salipaludibacillus sp. CUR1]MCE7793238.1 fructosamine kinase family protein [Salipaludibacillus sp. CUR1]
MTEVSWIKEALKQTGLNSGLLNVQPVSGGDINEAYHITTQTHELFIKTHSSMPADFFNIEAEGLRLLGKANDVYTPKVFGVFATESPLRHGLVMEWIEGGRPPGRADQLLGSSIANLHEMTHTSFGYSKLTYIGEIPQQNGWWTDWCTYYKRKRLRSQADLAEKNGLLPAKRKKRVEKLLERLDEWIPGSDITPRLLHGDLWSGNWMVSSGGYIYLIDPSVFYGHHEMELAFTELFGGFSNNFYDAYKERLPVDSEYNNRKPLYQLFYLFVHLNIFGEMYGSQVDSILKKYTG